MNYFSIIYDFLMIGLLSFGGGYTTIPMVKDIVDRYEVLNMEMLENFIAISESTPGPIAINLATFVGNEVAGFWGGVLATLFEILPAFVIILVFVTFFKKYIDNENVKFALSVIRPCIVGIIMVVGVSLYSKDLILKISKSKELWEKLEKIYSKLRVANIVNPEAIYTETKTMSYKLFLNDLYVLKYVIISIFVVLFIILYKKIFKKKASAIKIIIFGAFLGIIVSFLFDILLNRLVNMGVF